MLLHALTLNRKLHRIFLQKFRKWRHRRYREKLAFRILNIFFSSRSRKFQTKNRIRKEHKPRPRFTFCRFDSQGCFTPPDTPTLFPPVSVISQSHFSLRGKVQREELRFFRGRIPRRRSFLHYFTPSLKRFQLVASERAPVHSVPSGTSL